MTDILPTHDCFTDSLDLLVAILKENENDLSGRAVLARSLYLVHAVVTLGDREGAHAWVEDDRRDLVIFVGLYEGRRESFASPRDEYYQTHGVIERTRYAYHEAFLLNRITGHYGPWAERYQKLCRKPGDHQTVKVAATSLSIARDAVSITCPACGRTSYNQNDVREKYCGACHRFHEDMKP